MIANKPSQSNRTVNLTVKNNQFQNQHHHHHHNHTTNNNINNINNNPNNQTSLINNNISHHLDQPQNSPPVQYVVKKSTNQQTIFILSKSPNNNINDTSLNNTNVKTNGNSSNDFQQLYLNGCGNIHNEIMLARNNNNNNSIQTQNLPINSSSSPSLVSKHHHQHHHHHHHNVSQPITLIPIGNINSPPPPSQSNTKIDQASDQFANDISLFQPVETIEISTATVEITDSSLEDNNCSPNESTISYNENEDNSNKHDFSVDNSVIENIAENRIIIKSNCKVSRNLNLMSDGKKTNGKTSSSSLNDVTRCICGMDHDDGFMICCDKCLYAD
jgi:hypothetical protein